MKVKNNLILYIHGKGGNANEAEHFKILFPQYDVIGFDYKAQTPWDAKEEFCSFVISLSKKYNSIILIANSIGAFFSMSAGIDKYIKKAFFISPIVDMEKLICDMMNRVKVTESELKEKGVIHTDFREDLSWKYLSYIREHPIFLNVPTDIFYGGKDNLTSVETITSFAKKHNASLSIMKDGEHWFHTEEQMKFLDLWIKENF